MKINFKKTVSLIIAIVICAGAMTLTVLAQSGESTSLAGRSTFEAYDYSVKSLLDPGAVKNELAADFTSLGGWFKAGNYLVYENIDFGDGSYNTLMMLISVLNAEANKRIGVCVDGTATKIGEIVVSSSTNQMNNDVSVFREFYASVSAVTGVHDVYFVFPEDTNLNIDWFTFSTYSGTETVAEKDARMKWWRDATFGQFIHWGAYAYLGGVYNGRSVSYSEWIMNDLGISKEAYAADCAKLFNPTQFNAKDMVSVAKDAGQKYIILTSRHHEGFSMFDTKIRNFKDYAIMSYGDYTGPDPIAELSRECKEQGIIFGVYYTIFDWHDYSQSNNGNNMADGRKEEFKTRLKGQLRELVDFYDVDVLWFDGEWPGWWTTADGQEFYRYLRTMKPTLIANNRIGKRASTDGDYGTPEQEIPSTGLNYDWESCMTLNGSWGYHKNDNNWKNAQTVIYNVVDCASKGGNYLLNVGPDELGRVPQESQNILRAAGKWLEKFGDSIYGAGRSCFTNLGNGMKATTKEGKLYLHLLDFPKDHMAVIPKLENDILGMKLLGTDAEISYTEMKKNILLDLTGITADPYDTVIVISVNGIPQAVEEETEANLALKYATASATNIYGGGYEASKAVDGDMSSRWATTNAARNETLTLTFNEPITVNSAYLKQYVSSTNYTNGFNIEYWKDGAWQIAYVGGSVGEELDVYFDTITADQIRLRFTDAYRPTYYEFQLFYREQVGIEINSPVGGTTITYAAPFEVKGTAAGGSEVLLRIFDDNGPTQVTLPINADKTWSYTVTSACPGIVYFKAYLLDSEEEIIAIASANTIFRGAVDLAYGKPVTTSTFWGAGYEGAKAVDGDTYTRWAPLGRNSGDPRATLTVDFGEMTAFNRIRIDEWFDTYYVMDYRCLEFAIEYFDGADWKLLHEGTTIGQDFVLDFPAVTGRQVRLVLIDSWAHTTPPNENPSINSFEVYYVPAAYNVEVKPGTIVYGFDATVLVNADVSALKDGDEMTVTMFGKTLPVVQGSAIFKLNADDINVKGDCNPVIKVNGATIHTDAKLNVYELSSDIWVVNTIVQNENSVLAFNEYIEPRQGADFVVSVNGQVVQWQREGNSLILPMLLKDGDVVQIKNVMYPILFPSYAFTFTTVYSA